MGLLDSLSRPRVIVLTFLVINVLFLSKIYSSLQLGQNASSLSVPSSQTLSTIEPIVFALVMFGAASATEGTIAIKSVLMHASRPVDFHIITSHDAIPILESKFRLIKRPAYPINVFYYPLEAEDIRDRAKRAGVDTQYVAGMGGLVKVFIHEVLPSTVSKAIFFDTDMIFTTDPYLLWRRFDDFVPPQMISFPDLGEDSPAMDICTCTMLLHLDSMRSIERPFMDSTLFSRTSRPLGTNSLFRSNGIDPNNPMFGDQGLYWAIWTTYRQYFVHLPLAWDVSHCRFSYGMTLEGDDSLTEEQQIASQTRMNSVQEPFPQLFPGILHFNCQPDYDNIWEAPENKRRMRWSSYVNLSIDYKWIWLNKGDGTSYIKTTVVHERKFWDERLAEANRATAP